MTRVFYRLAIVGLCLSAEATVVARGPALPHGVTVIETDKGATLAAHDGVPLYQLDLDRFKTRGAERAALAAARCASENCMQYWQPLKPPARFRPVGDWTVAEGSSGPQLVYKGGPLYIFVGKSLDVLSQDRVSPPYFSAYSSPGTYFLSGVPVGTVYWHRVPYVRDMPSIVAPEGIKVDPTTKDFALKDANDHKLFLLRSAKNCAENCDGLQPLIAPLAAHSVGRWTPAPNEAGMLVWHYRDKIVYFAAKEMSAPPTLRWVSLLAK
jgi:predicted lipoprotein with Yx(FWY)xxD motif